MTDDKPMPLAGHKTALLLLVLAYALSIADRMIISILFVPIKTEFGLTDGQLGLLGGLSFALLYATLGVPIARQADRGNRKLIIIASLAIFSLMTAMSGLATGFITLVLFRIGVGIGEAGVNPASQSIVADYFPPHRRSFAMSILALGANIGMIVGFMVGGYVSQTYGWRAALFVVGAPGLLLAAVMFFLFREPPRGSFENDKMDKSPPISVSAKFMWQNKAIRHLMSGATIAVSISYGMGQWLPSFYTRNHGLDQTQIGIMMGLFFGILGAGGALLGGKLADRLSLQGLHKITNMLAVVAVVTIPFAIAAFMIEELPVATAVFIIPVLFSNFYLGPVLSLTQTLSPVHMRAVVAALKMLVMNLIGGGLGPLSVGLISDALTPYFGEDALRIALSIATLAGIWAAIHFWLCGRALLAQRQAAAS
ncbi:MAG: putative L-galactonate transporter [Alphaproteobacteria bacterium]|nr:MAG: putative L-galactonate transporter [Alphaproteobacteria bacterium]